jgi:large subunit ribosomal protein L10
MPTQQKIDLVADLKARFAESTNVFVTDYAGLNVEQLTKLRKNLREKGVQYVVAKNTLMRIAAKEAGYAGMDQLLLGPTAVAFSQAEPNVPAKILYDALKEYEAIGKPAIRAFFIDRQQFAGAKAESIAKLPPRNVLLAQVIAAVESPIAALVGTVDGILRELVGTVEALAKKKTEE